MKTRIVMAVKLFSIISLVVIAISLLLTGADAGETQWMAVGDLHDWYHSAGSEIEVGRTYEISDQQDGLRWPAQFRFQDSKAAKAFWIGTTDYDDPISGKFYGAKVVHIGPRVLDEENEFIPQEFTMIGKFDHPRVTVDGVLASQLDFMETVDEIDPDLPADRLLYNVVNTAIGITMTRKIYAFSQQNHSNYLVYDYTFKNTGIIDINGTTVQKTLTGVVFFWQYRYAPSREGGPYGYNWLPQSTSWGHSTMIDEMRTHPVTAEPFRMLFSWLGRHSKWDGPGDNIGGPNFEGDGRLGAPQFVGNITLHADTSPSDPTDNTGQPFTTDPVESDDQITYNNSQFNTPLMSVEYEAMTAGIPDPTHAESVGEGFADLSGGTPGGFSAAGGYGPYTMAFGDSVRIVIAEGVAGLSRDSCYSIGARWLADAGPFINPDGSTAPNANTYKNNWVFTGKDSLVKTFEHAKDAFDVTNGLSVPEPPPPPESFTVTSGGDRIILSWASNAETHPNFVGYRLYRAIQVPDTTYELIFECGPGTANPAVVNEYFDTNARRGFDYYYYVTAFDDGSTNDYGTGPLESGKFYTMTGDPAFLRRPPGKTLDAIRIVPNPFNIRARGIQFGTDAGRDRIMFYNIPAFCSIRIYTERGDLIKTLEHDDGSGDEEWNSVTSSRQIVVSGVYIAFIEVTRDHVNPLSGVSFKKGDSVIKKFIVVR